jgi:hypothetical protein
MPNFENFVVKILFLLSLALVLAFPTYLLVDFITKNKENKKEKELIKEKELSMLKEYIQDLQHNIRHLEEYLKIKLVFIGTKYVKKGGAK